MKADDKTTGFVVTALVITSIFLAIAKCAGAFNASWVWVLSPMWVTSLIGQCIIVVDFFVKIVRGEIK